MVAMAEVRTVMPQAHEGTSTSKRFGLINLIQTLPRNCVKDIGGPDERDSQPFAILAEFEDVDRRSLERQNESATKATSHWDVHSPMPIHGINVPMGLRPTILPWITLVHGVVGTADRFADGLVDQRQDGFRRADSLCRVTNIW